MLDAKSDGTESGACARSSLGVTLFAQVQLERFEVFLGVHTLERGRRLLAQIVVDKINQLRV